MVNARCDELGPTIAISHHQQGKGANCVEGGEDTVAGRVAQEAAFLYQHRLRQGNGFRREPIEAPADQVPAIRQQRKQSFETRKLSGQSRHARIAIKTGVPIRPPATGNNGP